MEYEIVYSKRKTLSLQVRYDLKIVVHAPYGLSRKYIEDFVLAKKKWIQERIEKIMALPVNPYEFSTDKIKELKEKTLSIVLPLVESYSKIMGLTPHKISASSAKRRFASCNSKGNLSFSFRLCLYPIEAIEYVVVHELAHMVEMNHSKKFWAVVEKYMPDYRQRRNLLK